MKNLLIISLISMTFMLKFCTNNKDLTETSSSPALIDSAGVPVNPLLNGFNAENLYFHYSGEKSADDMIAALKPNVLRFPGGTPANVYHINGPGYGYRDGDLSKMVEGTGPFKNAQKSVKRNNIQSKSASEPNHAVDFVRLVNYVGADVLLVANLLGNDEDILEMIRYFNDQGVPIVGVELGNEYYLKAYWNTFPNVQTYIIRAKQAAEAIRAEFPDLKLGVVAASSSELKDVSMKQKYHYDSWNESLAEEDFYDAYVSHVYSKSASCDAMAGQARFECYLSHNSEFVSEISGGFQSFSQTFKGKPAWITEWNIKTVFDGLGNTTLQALYYADFALSLTLSPDVEIATYHNLLTSSTGYNMIARDKSKNSASQDSHIARTAYPVAVLLAPIYDGNFMRISVPTEQFNTNVLTLACFQSASKRMFFIVNKSNAPLSLEGLGLEVSGDCEITGIVGESLGGSQWSTETKNIKPSETDKVTIRPYSVYRIELDLP